MTSSTVAVSLRISSFQNRITRNPLSLKKAVRRASAACRSMCWPPSSSMISLLSRQMKSTIEGAIGYWRRNLCPARWLRRCCQRRRSASVWFLRSCWAISVVILRNCFAMIFLSPPHPNPLPIRGEGIQIPTPVSPDEGGRKIKSPPA